MINFYIFVIFFRSRTETTHSWDSKGKKRNEGRQKSHNNELIQVNLLNFGFKYHKQKRTKTNELKENKKIATVHNSIVCCVMAGCVSGDYHFLLLSLEYNDVCNLYALYTVTKKNSLFNKKKKAMITNTSNNIEINEAFLFAYFFSRQENHTHISDLSIVWTGCRLVQTVRTSSERHTALFACTEKICNYLLRRWKCILCTTPKKRHANMNMNMECKQIRMGGKKAHGTEKRIYLH